MNKILYMKWNKKNEIIFVTVQTEHCKLYKDINREI